MSKQNEDDFDDDYNLEDEDENPSNPNLIGNSKNVPFPSSFSEPSSFGTSFNHSGGEKTGNGRMSPFHDMGMGMGMGGGFGGGGFGGGGFGGGFERFGSNQKGLSSDHNGPSSGDFFQNSFNQTFNKSKENGPQDLKKKEDQKPKNEPKNQEEYQKLKLLAKKLDIPEDQQVTIVDWAIRGSAELIRLILEYIKIPYKERKYVFKTKDSWLKVDKPKLQQTHPGIQLPYIEDGEKIIFGSEAIIIYILNKYNRTELLGTNEDEKVRLTTVSSIYWDLLQDYYQLCYGEYAQNLNWEKAKEKYINQKFRVHLNRMIAYLKHKSFPSSVDFNWVDFAIAEMVSILNEMDYRFKEQSTYIQNYAAKVFELPQFIVYRKSERFHQRPYNGLGAIYK